MTATAALVVEAPKRDFQGAVLAVLSERTGYPVDLIDFDLDLEADLSIDSIKRAEVAGDVVARLGLSAEGDESELEELVKARTVRAMVDWLTIRLDDAPTSAAAVAAVSAPAPGMPHPRTAAPAASDFQGAVLAVLSERTGYPVDLIDFDLDLEADLSIDSIKRAEVAGDVVARLGLSAEGDESELEELVKA
ncbi:phosphopantetheine-binding protein, partial [Dactylosporangium darangshiense]|uniref:phosphopantetheine-binding protein n=1 Tax=Dactylosporangium darangshiense TaxID=579108 RepID=UPI0031E7AC37